MDNTNDELQVEQETAEVEETTTEETTEETQEEDTVVISKEKFKAMQKKAIAYDASKKTPQKETITNNNVLSEIESEAKILKLAKDMDDDTISQLKKIALVNNQSLADAQKDPLFIAWQEKKESDIKAEKARLGASKGSSSTKASVGFSNPGLSEEDHKKLWKESMGR